MSSSSREERLLRDQRIAREKKEGQENELDDEFAEAHKNAKLNTRMAQQQELLERIA